MLGTRGASKHYARRLYRPRRASPAGASLRPHSELKRRQPGITNATRVGTDNWLPISAGRTGFVFWWWHTQNKLRTSLVFEDPDPSLNEKRFAWFLARR